MEMTVQKAQQPGEILFRDHSNSSIAAPLRSFGVSISTADADQHKSQSACQLLEVHPANEHLIVRAEGNDRPLLNSVDEKGAA
jgi:hypothetical protein